MTTPSVEKEGATAGKGEDCTAFMYKISFEQSTDYQLCIF